MRKGPLTNEALALESICVGKGPRFQNSAWQRDCTVDAEILELLAERIVRDWRSTAPSMRRAINGAGMEAKLKLCGAFKARSAFQSTVDDQAFNVEWALLHGKFMDQCLDIELEAALERQADPWDLSELTDIKLILGAQDPLHLL